MAVLPLASSWRPHPVLVGRSPIARDALPSYQLLAIMVAVILALAAALGFGGDDRSLPTVMTTQAALILFAMLFRWRDAPRVATAIEAAVLVLAATMASACLCVLFGTTAFPYRDGLLERADALLLPGYRWIDMYAALHQRDRLVSVMCAVYQTLLWQPFALVVILALTGRERFCWRFVQAWFLTLIACTAIFPFVPAVGAYIHHGLVSADIPALTVNTAWHQTEVLDRVRDGSIRALEPAKMTGMVSFPSFHAAGAILLFWGFRRVRLVGPAFMALNVAMCLTAPLIGAHYFIDIAGGIGIALLGIMGSRPGSASALPLARLRAK